jgi:hypothetical protein
MFTFTDGLAGLSLSGRVIGERTVKPSNELPESIAQKVARLERERV